MGQVPSVEADAVWKRQSWKLTYVLGVLANVWRWRGEIGVSLKSLCYKSKNYKRKQYPRQGERDGETERASVMVSDEQMLVSRARQDSGKRGRLGLNLPLTQAQSWHSSCSHFSSLKRKTGPPLEFRHIHPIAYYVPKNADSLVQKMPSSTASPSSRTMMFI